MTIIEYLRHFGWVLPVLFFGVWMFVAMYIVAPLIIRQKQIRPTRIDTYPIDLPSMPADFASVFHDAARRLVPCGFQAIGHGGMQNQRTGQDAFLSIWINRETCDSSQVIGVATPWPIGGTRIVTLVTFRTEFSDGTSIVTTNATRSASSFPRDPRVFSLRCPGVHDVSLLYRVHRALVERDRKSRTATLDGVTPPTTRLQWEHSQMYERLIRAGCYRLDQAGENYIPTFKGAYLMTYRLLPPFKQIQKITRDRAWERTIRELGFGGMTQLQTMQSRTESVPA